MVLKYLYLPLHKELGLLGNAYDFYGCQAHSDTHVGDKVTGYCCQGASTFGSIEDTHISEELSLHLTIISCCGVHYRDDTFEARED